MDAKWSYGGDPANKYLIHHKVKRDLANYWIRGHDGHAWVLQEDLSEIVFVDKVWDEWRRLFEAEKAILADKRRRYWKVRHLVVQHLGALCSRMRYGCVPIHIWCVGGVSGCHQVPTSSN